MGLAESVKAARVQRGPTCAIAIVRTKLSAADLKVLDKLLADVSIQHTELATGLKAETGMNIDPQVVSRHRRGKCVCGTR